MELSGVVPTKGNLLANKKSLALARTGHELMERKRTILVQEMLALVERARALGDTINETFQSAYNALQRANITLGVCGGLARSMPVEHGLSISLRSVMGVELPTVRLDTPEPHPVYDFSSTNSAFDSAYLGFYQVKLLTVQLAEIENSIYRLAVAIKKTQSRSNALRHVIIPKLEASVRFIADALEEKEREEFTRMKVIKAGNK